MLEAVGHGMQWQGGVGASDQRLSLRRSGIIFARHESLWGICLISESVDPVRGYGFCFSWEMERFLNLFNWWAGTSGES